MPLLIYFLTLRIRFSYILQIQKRHFFLRRRYSGRAIIEKSLINLQKYEANPTKEWTSLTVVDSGKSCTAIMPLSVGCIPYLNTLYAKYSTSVYRKAHFSSFSSSLLLTKIAKTSFITSICDSNVSVATKISSI